MVEDGQALFHWLNGGQSQEDTSTQKTSWKENIDSGSESRKSSGGWSREGISSQGWGCGNSSTTR